VKIVKSYKGVVRPGRARVVPEFDWIKVLKRAKRRRPTVDELEDMIGLAYSWPTCACGQLCKALPRDEDGIPDDDSLIRLGLWFADSVVAEDWKHALEIFLEIEARTIELLAEMNTKNRKKQK
jgi:hypothetical protein